MKRWAISLILAASCMAASQNAIADADLGFKALGVRAGMVSPENVDATLGFGVFADLGQMTPEIKLEPYMDYWSISQDFGVGTSSLRDVAIGARGKYMFPSSSNIRPFAGAGLGLHLLHSEVDVPAQDIGGFVIPAQHAEDSTTRLGLDLGGGLEVPVNPRTNFLGEVWYGIVSDVGQLSLKVGMSWQLGQ
jgi:opacity protein-like surface antigen